MAELMVSPSSYKDPNHSLEASSGFYGSMAKSCQLFYESHYVISCLVEAKIIVLGKV